MRKLSFASPGAGHACVKSSPDGRRHEQTVWSLDSTTDPSVPLGAHLIELLDHVEVCRQAVAGLTEDGCQIDWFCYLEATPTGNVVTFGAEPLHPLASLGGAIAFDIYESTD